MMSASAFDTMNLQGWLARLRAGDRDAKNELLRACQSRLEHLTRRMLKKYTSVRRWADTADVVQNASMRLLRALEETAITDTRHFINLAAKVIGRELVDLARHFRGPQGLDHNHASGFQDAAVADTSNDRLDWWVSLHEAVEQLPAEEREVFMLTFYHGWSQKQISELFEIDERTVRRWWKAASANLAAALGNQPPP